MIAAVAPGACCQHVHVVSTCMLSMCVAVSETSKYLLVYNSFELIFKIILAVMMDWGSYHCDCVCDLVFIHFHLPIEQLPTVSSTLIYA